MTDEVVRKLTEAFKLDVTVEEACLYANISKDAYYRKLKEDEEFSDEIGHARHACSDIGLSLGAAIISSMVSGLLIPFLFGKENWIWRMQAAPSRPSCRTFSLSPSTSPSRAGCCNERNPYGTATMHGL